MFRANMSRMSMGGHGIATQSIFTTGYSLHSYSQLLRMVLKLR